MKKKGAAKQIHNQKLGLGYKYQKIIILCLNLKMNFKN